MDTTFSVQLPNDQEFIVRMVYTVSQARAIGALVAASVLSLLAVLLLFVIFAISAVKSYRTPMEGQFIRTHVAAYFVSLLITDFLQAIGSIMNARWISAMSATYGEFCVAQGVIKQMSDVGTATWNLIVAIHTFNVLFLRFNLRRYAMWVALTGGWCFIGAVVIAGPATLDTVERGPFWGISGYWCWISAGYTSQRITLDYMIMFISAASSFFLYSLVFLKLRGNIVSHGRRFRWRWISRTKAWTSHPRQSDSSVDAHTMKVAKHMLLYPIAYAILLLPIAAARFAAWTGHDVPFAVTIFSDFIFLLSGFVNTSLFLFTRRVLPLGDLFPKLRRTNSRSSIEKGIAEIQGALPPRIMVNVPGAESTSSQDSTSLNSSQTSISPAPDYTSMVSPRTEQVPQPLHSVESVESVVMPESRSQPAPALPVPATQNGSPASQWSFRFTNIRGENTRNPFADFALLSPPPGRNSTARPLPALPTGVTRNSFSPIDMNSG